MSTVTKQVIDLMEILPESEQNFALEFIKKLVLAWDPDFTKVTPEEAKRLQAAEESGFIDESEVDWTNLGRAYQ